MKAAGEPQALGNFRNSTDDDLDSYTGMPQHGHQRIDAESVDLAPDEIAHPRLGYAEERGSLRLGQLPGLDQFAEADHQVASDFEVLGFLAGKTKIAKDIAA